MTVEQAFQAIASNCLAQIEANAAGVAHTMAIESVHQMRVGLRRLRSAIDLFKDVLAPPPALGDELGWLADALTEARDWDVMAYTTLPAIEHAALTQAPLGALLLAVRAKARAGHAAAAKDISAPRYADLLAQLRHWVDDRGWRDTLAAPARQQLDLPVRPFADAVLAKCERRLRKRGRHVDRAPSAARHRARIAAKKARYAAEFFRALYGGRPMRAYLAALTQVQDVLGELNDAVVAERLLPSLSGAATTHAHAIGYVQGFQAARTGDTLVCLRRTWKAFAASTSPAA